MGNVWPKYSMIACQVKLELEYEDMQQITSGRKICSIMQNTPVSAGAPRDGRFHETTANRGKPMAA
ncbi:MAG TPA: hypothetical protein VLX29_02105 [Nitrospirota bacterium]|nr:hypothetical protein [Nitrospirota bacterium]